MQLLTINRTIQASKAQVRTCMKTGFLSATVASIQMRLNLGHVKIKNVAIGHQHRSSDAGYGDHIHGVLGVMLAWKPFGIDNSTIVKAAMEQHAFKRNV